MAYILQQAGHFIQCKMQYDCSKCVNIALYGGSFYINNDNVHICIAIDAGSF